MADIGNEETVPGFTVQSEQFMLTFISAFKKGLSSHQLEYETDWLEVMIIILDTLEMFPNNVDVTERVVSKTLEDWVASHEGAENLNIKAAVKMEEKVYFSPPLGTKKCMRVMFADKWNTEVLFRVKKKIGMESMKDLAAGAVADCLEKEDDIVQLEIPMTLIYNLVKQFRNDWSAKYYKSHINCCTDHRDGVKSVNEWCEFLKIINN